MQVPRAYSLRGCSSHKQAGNNRHVLTATNCSPGVLRCVDVFCTDVWLDMAAGKLEAALKGMVAEVAKSLEKGQHRMGKRVADMFTILWYVHMAAC